MLVVLIAELLNFTNGAGEIRRRFSFPPE